MTQIQTSKYTRYMERKKNNLTLYIYRGKIIITTRAEGVFFLFFVYAYIPSLASADMLWLISQIFTSAAL